MKTGPPGPVFARTGAVTTLSHGASRSAGRWPEYCVWDAMKQRCLNPRQKNYSSYGGRGIKVCERWLKFDAFIADMGRRPSKRHTLDRIDNDGDYEPGNCRWAMRKVQQRNRRANHVITLHGLSATLVEWSERTGISDKIISARIHNSGWTPEKAVSVPVGKHETLLACNGKTLNVSRWAKEIGVSNSCIEYRLRQGWPIEKTLTTPSNRNRARR